MKKLPCPKCNKKKIEHYDCNYSTFNCWGDRCKNCGFTVHDGFGTGDIKAKNWDEGVKNFFRKTKALQKLTPLERELLGYPRNMKDS